ncbi:DNA helicase Pif1-like [Trema orientale]|uniref:ATP-dependent DNA helicase n=1 Tax=Trema orientale TaxID=63057 RepID=A0A2P5DB44_TREOI|nr:DNA helicase Pif1-like [Trema orientale]
MSHLLQSPSLCGYCGAKKFQYESEGFCCSVGKVVLKGNDVPTELYELFTSTSIEAREFKRNIRIYNNNFSFTSFGVKQDKDLCSMNKGLYTFRVQGQIYHYINRIIPALDNAPVYLQLYFHDTDNELENRMSFSERMTLPTLSKISDLLEVNPYCQFFRSLGSVSDLENHMIQIRCDSGLDQRVYNAPSVSQVAAIWVDDDISAEHRSRDIIVSCHDGESHKIHYYFGCYDPLQYPLLFPYGETGWHQGIQKYITKKEKLSCHNENLINAHAVGSASKLIAAETRGTLRVQFFSNRFGCLSTHYISDHCLNLFCVFFCSPVLESKKKRNSVSCREYYCYKLQMRPLIKSVLLHSGRLLQQYVVDMYVKVETSRLDYFRNKQAEIQAELYRGIIDSIEVGETRGSKIGRRIILPSSFVGGPRDMRKRYIDAMALVQRFGKPDLFLTMTCNPNWQEIREELGDNDEIQNRPDLVTRIFRAKLEEVKNDLIKKQIFGRVAAYVYVIEFQKRGLPHAHFLLILKPGSKIVNPELFDKIVSAELPNKEKYPSLFSFVVKHMMHGPCGILNQKNICMQKGGKCRNHYPKPFRSKTECGEDSYPKYRRHDDGIKVKVRGQWLDNRWVVPYSPYLLAKFDCHINVEICSTVKAVKYLYKYVYKGHDRVSFSIASNNDSYVIDEITMFQSARWISPPEAMWRIYGFILSEIYPAVISLQLHLEDNQMITYRETDNLSKVIDSDITTRSMLTEFFKMNATGKENRNLLYRDFPEFFVWDKQNKIWTKRKHGGVIGRIVAANPVEGERYYLRLLLSHIRGPTSYNDLRIVYGITVSSFRESALLHGLLEGDNNIDLCLEEATSYQMPFELRRLFATILVFCVPNNPKLLWDKFKRFMSEDYIAKKMGSVIEESKTLEDINFMLEGMGKSLDDYGLPHPAIKLGQQERITKMVNEELQVSISNDDLISQEKLNSEQKVAFNMILEKVFANKSGMFFVDGPGGTGKTYLYRALLAAVRSKNFVALATASSGVAAGILPGGRTVHSRFKIPLLFDEATSCSVSKQSALSALLRMTKLIIWDEAPMVHRHAIESLDKMLQDVNESSLPFGGKVIVFGGDFRQVLPVVLKGRKEDIIKATLVQSYLWKSFTNIKLVQNMRAKSDTSFSEYLLRIGNGEEECDSLDRVQLPNNMIIPFKDQVVSLGELLDVVFPKLDVYCRDVHKVVNRVILTPKNVYVDQINNIMIDRFPGDAVVYYSFDEPMDKTEHNFEEDFFNALTPSGVPPHELVLKPNCPVILLRNINSAEGLCNGTRLICRHFQRNVIDAEIAVGEYRGKRVFLPRIHFVPLEGHKDPFSFKRIQFPIRPCFAMTINKAQGQTLDFMGLYLPEPVFSHGQLYVALSRVRKANAIKILLETSSNNPDSYARTKNVVYDEVLHLANSTTTK